VVLLLGGLAAAEAHLRGIDYDDEVAHVEMRLEVGLVLAAQERGDFGCDAAERAVGGVDHMPVLGDLAGFHADCLRRHTRYPSSYHTRQRQRPCGCAVGPSVPGRASCSRRSNSSTSSAPRPTSTSAPTM